VPGDDAFRRSIIGDDAVITDRPADHLEPEFARLKAELGDLARTDEDVLTYALFPQVGKAYLQEVYYPTIPEENADKKAPSSDETPEAVIRIQARYRS
jgi:oxaloacetate decarboxylase alpha subunit